MAKFMDKIKKKNAILGIRKNVTLPEGSQALSFRPCDSCVTVKTLEGWGVIS
jgi:hypothetical protein